MVRLLIQNGANVNEVNGGETVLHATATAGNLISLMFTLKLKLKQTVNSFEPKNGA